MKLTSIQLSKYKCFESTGEIILSPGINVFVGKNDQGKSTFLESLRHFMDFNSSSEAQIYIRNSEQNFSVTLGVENVQPNNFIINPTVHVIEGVPGTIALLYERGSIFQFRFRNASGGEISKNTGSGIFASGRENAPIFFIDPDRFLKSSHQVGRQEALQQDPRGGHAAALIDELVSSDDRDELESITRDLFGFRVQAIPHTPGQKMIGKTNTSGKRIDARHMGSGVSHVAFLLAHFIGLKDAVVIIDEIEHSLHPELLKKLLDYIFKKAKENNLQVLIGTHSNIVVMRAGFDPENKIYEIRQNGDKSGVFAINTTEDRHKLISELGYSPSDLGVYDAFLITEESTAEKFIAHVIIPIFRPGLIGRIKIVAAEGAGDVPLTVRITEKLFLFQYLNGSLVQRTWVICDGDIPGLKAIKDIKEWEKAIPDQYHNLSEGKMIESYYPTSIVENFLRDNKLSTLSDLYKDPNSNQLKVTLLSQVIECLGKGADFFSTEAKDIIDIINSIEV